MDRQELERIAKIVLDSAYKVHTALGAGMLESSYETCLAYEINKSCIKVKTQVELPIIYEDVKLDAGYRIDLFVEDELIVEIKAVERLHPVHHAQLMSYLKLSKKPLGLLVNFNVPHLRDGIKRIVNNH